MITDLMTNPSIATVLVVALWGGLLACVFIKQEWFFNFDERFPRMHIFDMQIVTDMGRMGFLFARLIFIFLIAYVIGMFIVLIYS